MYCFFLFIESIFNMETNISSTLLVRYIPANPFYGLRGIINDLVKIIKGSNDFYCSILRAENIYQNVVY